MAGLEGRSPDQGWHIMQIWDRFKLTDENTFPKYPFSNTQVFGVMDETIETWSIRWLGRDREYQVVKARYEVAGWFINQNNAFLTFLEDKAR